MASSKHNAIKAYYDFINLSITDFEDKEKQNRIFTSLKKGIENKKIGVVCDFNGSARTISIDKGYFKNLGINFYSMNDQPGQIEHEIIPEAENLVHVAKFMEELQAQGKTDALLGYMPDCDGDRGNIVYWDEKEKKAVILKAQEVFSLSVLAELTYSIWKNPEENKAVCVNCPTSMRIDEITQRLGAKLFRAEVGEANVVNCAREHREEGYAIRILGEGSNGGTITYPSAVRDPLNTIFALLKLLLIRDENKDGLYHIWCKKSDLEYKEDFTLSDVINSLPKYTTTGVSESRAVLHIKNPNHSELKAKFQKIFVADWDKKRAELVEKYGICSWEAIITKGTKESKDVLDFSLSEKGGLKVLFKDFKGDPLAFIWMRGSGTEPVFRIMCDVKGDNPQMEKELLAWESDMLLRADSN